MKKTIFTALIITTIILFASCVKRPVPQTNAGKVFGTYYAIKYRAAENYSEGFDSVFAQINKSLSTFDASSVISTINSSDTAVPVDEHFTKVYEDALYVSEATGGAFDITVAPLVNFWGFGYDPESKSSVRSDAQIDSIMEFVGYRKISLENGLLTKQDSRIKLDCSAIAKGYACDAVAALLDEKGVKDYLVDIGGEMVAKGTNFSNEPWRIGIVSPVDDSLQTNNSVEQVIELKERAIATSGNYRQFYITKERKVSHTINPLTGYPTDHKLLSASVLAPACDIADAYATSFMVIGDTAKIRNIIKASKYNIEAFLIMDSAGVHKQLTISK